MLRRLRRQGPFHLLRYIRQTDNDANGAEWLGGDFRERIGSMGVKFLGWDGEEGRARRVGREGSQDLDLAMNLDLAAGEDLINKRDSCLATKWLGWPPDIHR